MVTPYLRNRVDNPFSNLFKSFSGVTLKRFDSYCLHRPDSVNTESMGMRGIGSVTHFMECCRQSTTEPIGLPLDKPTVVPKGHATPHSQALNELGLARLPRRKDGTIVSIFVLDLSIRYWLCSTQVGSSSSVNL